MKKVVKRPLEPTGLNRASRAQSVVAYLIIGNNIESNGNVKVVGIEQL